MQFTTTILLACASVASAQYTWGDWGAMNPCAQPCFASAYPGTSSSWSSHCASQTLLNNCIKSSCSTMTAVQTSASAAQSAQCSAFSSCSTVQDVCTYAYPWWGGWSAWGWDGPYHDGMYTVTTDAQTTGLTTRTVTSAVSGVTSTATQTATLVAAAVASTTNAAATATATHNAGSSRGVNAAGALIGAAIVAMIAM
ncbi:uncharacterized protein LY89DRAFT_736378 [Mollisia scopiformis]|uniref:Extracellular membrane protein CFEM domain-containing protein n=1 Tax=Mollisia scopiformis TaxID=149040 RepID=A0A194X2D4_MOLSC|nr:uncharacterized protein LY89DRAFT_736378 [Mollisia scopiformis]KUJ14333.1 hypothetical protein LY89DRAFT_736378 [Mollisia scopiformis]